MSTKKKLDTTVFSLAVVGSLIFVNILGIGLFGRLDMTRDKQFTLSAASITALERLDDPVTVRAYFTKDLPPPYANNVRYVKDLLDEYYAHGSGNFSFEFIDPIAEETSEDKEKKKNKKRDIFGNVIREATSVERELQGLQIPPVQVRVNQDDKIEVKRAYMGIAIHYRDKTEVIPVVQDTGGLEYDLTTLIRKASRDKPPKVAVLTGHEEPSLDEDMGRINGVLGQLYEVTTVNLSSGDQIPEDADALLVIGPKTALSDSEKEAIDRYVMSGRSAAFLLNAVVPDTRTLQVEETAHGLGDLLAAYGVKIGEGLVLDAECATISIQQQQGFMRIMQPVRYPFMPVPEQLDPQHPLTRGLAQVAFPFVSPLELTVPDDSGVKAEVLVRSSPKSWVMTPPYNMDPRQRWAPEIAENEPGKALVVTLRGPIKSYSQRSQSTSDASVPPQDEAVHADDARVLVAGGASFITDQFMSASNQAFVLNLVDWLVLDEALLAVRARGLRAAPLDELTDAERKAVKYFNIAGLPMAFVGIGLVRWRVREKRRGQIAL